MNLTMMQPKLYQLRLNLEQLNHTIDGWVENRKCISEESLDLYDSQFADVLDQFQSQGVDIMIDLEEQETKKDEEASKAMEIIQNIEKQLENASMDRYERHLLQQVVGDLRTLLFGEEDGRE